jgi:site-specific DNA-methyltransferase (adenine-specific)
MPEQLLGRIIRACSNPGELVLDPFSGSATTLAVAKKLGRRWLGFDLSKEYVDSGLARLERIRTGERLDGAPEPLVSAPATAEGKRLGGKGPTTSSPIGETSSLDVPPRHHTLTEDQQRAIVLEAFLRVHDGFSSDYVLTNPELNAAFVEACLKLGGPLAARQVNRMLLRLRKSRSLSIHATRRVNLEPGHVERFLFASEIAARKMHDKGHTLDDVLCDPALAGQFDGIAAQFAPGFGGFDYRWGALRVRKAHRKRIAACQRLDEADRRRRGSRPITVQEVARATLPNAAGVYRLWSRGGNELYVGSAESLRERLLNQFAEPLSQRYGDSATQCFLSMIPVDSSAIKTRGALQGLLIVRYRPLLNFTSSTDYRSIAV